MSENGLGLGLGGLLNVGHDVGGRDGGSGRGCRGMLVIGGWDGGGVDGGWGVGLGWHSVWGGGEWGICRKGVVGGIDV